MPLFKIKSPGNVNAFNDFFAELANFNVVDTTDYTNDIFYFPEMDAISLNFQNAGYDTNLVIPSLGTLFYMMIGQIGFVVLHFLLLLLTEAIPKVGVLKNKVYRYLYWNGSIRFMMEGYMDIVLFSLLNIESMNWDDTFWAVTASNYIAIALTVLLCGLPIFFIYFYSKNMQNWNDEAF